MRKILIAMILFMLLFIPISQAKPYYSSERYGCFEVTWKGKVGVVRQNYVVTIRELCGYNRYIYPTFVIDQLPINPNRVSIKIFRIYTDTVAENTTIPIQVYNTYNYTYNDFSPPVLNETDLILYPNCYDNNDNATFSCSEIIYENTTQLVQEQLDKDVNYVVERFGSMVKAKVEEPIFVSKYGTTKLRVKIKYKHAVKRGKKWMTGRVGVVIDGHLYHPWWNTSWSYRKMLNVKNYLNLQYNPSTNPAAGGKIFLINITKFPEMNDNYSDVRITALDPYLGEEEVPFVFIKKTPTYALAIAKIVPEYTAYVRSSTTSEDLVVYLYYGNPNPPPLSYSYSDVFYQQTNIYKQLSGKISSVVKSRKDESIAVYYSVFNYELRISWQLIKNDTILSGSYAFYNAYLPVRAGFVRGVYFDDDYIYIPFAIQSYNDYRWRGYLLKINKSAFGDVTQLYLGINIFPYDVVGYDGYLYVIGRYGFNSDIIKINPVNMTVVGSNVFSLSAGNDYLYYPVDMSTPCAFAYAYIGTNFNIHYVCWDSNLSVTLDKVLWHNTRVNDVEHVNNTIYVLLSNSTVLLLNNSADTIRAITLPSAGYDMNVFASLLMVYLGNRIYYYDLDTGDHSSITASVTNRVGKYSVDYADNIAKYFLAKAYAYYLNRYFGFNTHIRCCVEYAPRLEWYNALPVHIYNNDSINYTNVVAHMTLNRSEGMNPDYSDILVTLPTTGYWSYVPHYIESYNATHFNISIYLGNVSAYENKTLLIRFNKSVDFNPYFINHPFFTYPLFVGKVNGITYFKGIYGQLDLDGVRVTSTTLATTMNFSVPAVIYVESLITSDTNLYAYIYDADSNQLSYIARFYIRGTAQFALMDNQSTVLCMYTVPYSLPFRIEFLHNGTLEVQQANAVCSAPINKYHRYYVKFKSYYWPITITKLRGYSYLEDYTVDPPVQSNYAVDIETLNNPPIITITSPRAYSYYNQPILKFVATDDQSSTFMIRVILDNTTIYEDYDYVNGTQTTIDLAYYINQTTDMLHIVQVVAYDGASYTYSDEIPFYYAPFEFYTTMKSDFIEKYDYQQINLSTTLVNTTNFIIEWWYSDFDTTYAPQNDTVVPNCSLPWCNATYEIPCTQNSFVYFNAYVTNGTNTYKAGPFSYICGGLPASVGVTTPTPVQTAGGGLSPNTELDVKSFAIKVPEGQCVDDVLVVELKHDWFTYNATLEIYDLPSNMIFYPSNIVIKPGSNLIDISICGVETGDYAGRAVVTLENGIEDSAEIAVHVRSFSQSLMEMARSWWVWLIVLVGLVLWHKGKT